MGPPRINVQQTREVPQGSQDRPDSGGCCRDSAFTPVSRLAPLIKFPESLLQCLWKYNFAQEIHV